MKHAKQLIKQGASLDKASAAVVFIHGRGGTAQDILSLQHYLNVGDYSLVAPQATGHTWYPYSFLAAPVQNEPYLSDALQLLKEVVVDIENEGIAKNNIYFVGFSQGACLTLEFVTRNAAKYGGVAAFTGGLIGDKLYKENYKGDFMQTPIFIGSADPDPHVPVSRVEETTKILKEMNAAVHTTIYKGMGHTISDEEIAQANQIVFTAQ